MSTTQRIPVIVDISAQTSKFQKAIQGLKNLKLNDSLFGGNKSNTSATISKEIQKLQEKLISLKEFSRDPFTMKSDFSTAMSEAKSLEQRLEDVRKTYDKVSKATTEGQKIKFFKDDSVQEIVNFVNRTKNAKEKTEEFKFAVERLQDVGDALGTSLKDDASNIEDFQKALDARALKDWYEYVDATPNAIKEMDSALSSAQREILQVGEAWDVAERKTQDFLRLKDQVMDFFSIGNTIQIFKRTVNDAFDTIKELDAAMTESAVVTEYSVQDMWERLGEYTVMANEVGSTIADAYDAVTLFYQQGLDTTQAMALGVETLKMARIAGIETADATDYMTSALRGFNMALDETSAKRVNDVYSKIAAITASDTQEISIAMSKVASLANNANMTFENTASILAKIIETTREAPETA